MKAYIPLCKTNDPKIAKLWEDICNDQQKRHDEWVEYLRGNGIAAAHPDDGWVDRENNTIQFAYPGFGRNNIKIGALVALGNYKKYRIVKIIEEEELLGGFKRWKFESCPNSP